MSEISEIPFVCLHFSELTRDEVLHPADAPGGNALEDEENGQEERAEKGRGLPRSLHVYVVLFVVSSLLFALYLWLEDLFRRPCLERLAWVANHGHAALLCRHSSVFEAPIG